MRRGGTYYRGSRYSGGGHRIRGRGDYNIFKKGYQWLKHAVPKGTGRRIGTWVGRQAGRSVGRAVAKRFKISPGVFAPLGSLGAKAGGWLGNTAAKITGVGDYNIVSNSVLGRGHAPTFGDDTIRVKKREMITTIPMTDTFTVTSFPINPGLNGTFPWLAPIAQNFENYKIIGMMFEFVSTSSDAIADTANLSLGQVVMATDYNSGDSNYRNIQQMLGSMFSNARKPSQSFYHAIECDPRSKPYKFHYVRTGGINVNADIRLFDYGNFQIATQGPADYTEAGQLWVTYDIELSKSVMNASLGFAMPMGLFESNAQVDFTSNPLGPTGTLLTVYNNIISEFTFDPTNDEIEIAMDPVILQGYFQIELYHTFTGANTMEPFILADGNNVEEGEVWQNSLLTARTDDAIAPNGAESAIKWVHRFVIRLTGRNATFRTRS